MRHTPFDLDDDSAYRSWRDRKLGDAPAALDDLVVEVEDPRTLTEPEHQALMQEDTMLIPKNVVDGVEIRPDRIGPLFMVAADGHLHMRYTMRKRNVVWKDDPLVKEAVAWLEGLLKGELCAGRPYIYRATLQPGWGLVCNNVLHDRTAFEDDPDPAGKRLLYRARYHDRLHGM